MQYTYLRMFAETLQAKGYISADETLSCATDLLEDMVYEAQRDVKRVTVEVDIPTDDFVELFPEVTMGMVKPTGTPTVIAMTPGHLARANTLLTDALSGAKEELGYAQAAGNRLLVDKLRDRISRLEPIAHAIKEAFYQRSIVYRR